MEFEHFSFIVRMRDDAGDIKAHWNSLFAFFTKEETAGTKLYYRYDDTLLIFPEKHYVLTISNMSVKKARLLTTRFQEAYPEKERLTVTNPYPQNNDFRDAPLFDCLGIVDDNGTVSGSTASIGDMRFTGNATSDKHKRKAILFISTDFAKRQSAVKDFIKKHPDFSLTLYPDYSEQSEMVPWVCVLNHACYHRTADGFPYYRMYDDAVVFSSNDAEEAKNIADVLSARGFEHFLCVSDENSMLSTGYEVVSSTELFKRYYPKSSLRTEVDDSDLIVCSKSMKALLDECSDKERNVVFL